MKRIVILILSGLAGWSLEASAAGSAGQMDREMARAVAEVRAAIDASERQSIEAQSLEELHAAAYEQIVRELKLSREQRKRFEPLYREYRRALDRAVDASAAQDRTLDDATQRRVLKAKLGNISATAEVKRDYVDRFAEILTAEQIRQLYNTEGQIGTSIKRATAGVTPAPSKLRGSGRLVTQDWGAAGDYTAIAAGTYVRVTISSTARTVSVTADDNVIEHLAMERENGMLRFRVVMENGRNISMSNISVSVVVPASPALRSIWAGSYGSVLCRAPLRGDSFEVKILNYGAVEADLDAQGEVALSISSYGKFSGALRCDTGRIGILSYGSLQAPVTCRTRCDLSIGSYSKFVKNTVSAPDLVLAVASGGSFSGDVIAKNELKLSVQSYGKFAGSVDCGRGTLRLLSYASMSGGVTAAGAISLDASSYAKFSGSLTSPSAELRVQSYGSFSGAFSGDALDASVGVYGKVDLSGAAKVRKAKVSVGMGAAFYAQELQVEEYDLQVQNNGKAGVRCQGVLRVEAAQTARIDYDGPCRVENRSLNVRRR